MLGVVAGESGKQVIVTLQVQMIGGCGTGRAVL